MEKVLITGVTGFVGSHIADLCLDKGVEVFGFKRYHLSKMDNIKHIEDKINLAKEKADKIFSTNEINKQDIIRGQKLYKKSKKLKRSRELIKERLSIYKTNIERLDEFTTLLENLNSLNHEKLFMRIKLLEEIMEEICNEFNINIKRQREDKKSSSEIQSSPIQVAGTDGTSSLFMPEESD